MNHIHYTSQGRKSQPKINNKKRLTEDQVRLLETSFNFNNKLDPDQKLQLAMELGISSRRVAVWYQNKRARWKSQSLEDDHRTVKMRLESALLENERLEREVVRLRQDLDKAHDMLVTINSSNNNNNNNNNNNYNSSFSSLSASCDEVGSSSLFHEDSRPCLDKDLYGFDWFKRLN